MPDDLRYRYSTVLLAGLVSALQLADNRVQIAFLVQSASGR